MTKGVINNFDKFFAENSIDVILDPVIFFVNNYFWWESKITSLALRLFINYKIHITNYWDILLKEYIVFFDLFLFLLLLLALLTIATITKRNLTYISAVILLSLMIINTALTINISYTAKVSDLLFYPFIAEYTIIILVISIIWYILCNYYRSFFNYSTIIISLFIIFSIILLLYANDLILIYIGIEMSAFGLYTLSGLNRQSLNSTESSLKYFIISVFFSTLFIISVSLLYYIMGTTNLIFIQSLLIINDNNIVINIICSFMILSLIGKIGLVPFHYWFIDVYSSIPSKIAIFFIIFPKLSLLYLIGKFMWLFAITYNNIIIMILLLITIIVSGFMAIIQSNFRRFIAYSIIFNNSFLLASIITLNIFGLSSIILFIIFYFLILMTIFIIVNQYNIQNIRQLIMIPKNIIGIIFSISLLNLAGIPPLSLFFAKFCIILNVINSGYLYIGILLIAATILSAYYYIRIVKNVYFSVTIYIKSIDKILNYDNKYIKHIKISFTVSIFLMILLYLQLIFVFYPKLINLLTIGLFF
jgi:NADH-quinone oxidoreductase subunit N